jgi:hypothetical protein
VLAERGVQHHPGAAALFLADLTRLLEKVSVERAGASLYGVSGFDALLGASGVIDAVAAHHLGPVARPVRALLFDESASGSWSLGWHQDRKIVVTEHHEVECFGPHRLGRIPRPSDDLLVGNLATFGERQNPQPRAFGVDGQ